MKLYCDTCEGSGKVLDKNYNEVKCEACEGNGYLDIDYCIEVYKALMWVKNWYDFKDEYGRIAFDEIGDVVKAYRKARDE
jgi:hypothetical protein